jgi:O-antigen/teichoic acid export membrane protein
MKQVLPSFEAASESMYRPILRFSVPLVAFQGIGFLNSNLDIYMIGFFMNSGSVGVYNVALQLANLLTAVLLTIGFLLPPMLTRLQEQGKKEEMRLLYQALTKWTILIGVPIFVVLFFAPKLVIRFLFGPTYVSGVPVLRVLLVALIFPILLGLNHKALISLGQNHVVSMIMAIQVSVNGLLNLLLIPDFGLVGAAGAMATSIVIGNILGVLVLYRRFGIHPFTYRTFATLGILLFVCTAFYVFHILLNIPELLVVPVICVVYPVVVWNFTLEVEDMELMRDLKERI